MRRADAVLLELLALTETLRAGRDDERGLPAGSEVGVDRGDDDVHVRDAAIGHPGLGAVDDPLVGRLFITGAGEDRRDIGAGVRVPRNRTRASLRSSMVPNIWGSHSPNCSGVPVAASDAAARPVPEMDSPMPASPQNISSNSDQGAQPAGFGMHGDHQFHRVQPDLRGLLDDRPGRFLPFVPLRRRRTNDVLSEVVHPVAELDDVVREFERERHGHWSFRWSNRNRETGIGLTEEAPHNHSSNECNN